MKRLFIFLAAAMMAAGAMAGKINAPKVKVMGDLRPYKYAYIIPTGSVTSSSGSGAVIGYMVISDGTKTVNPGEIIAGYLIKQGYVILPSIVPELADETMIFSYGNAGFRQKGALASASKIVIQITSCKTHELLATVEAEGRGETEADDISLALYKALTILTYTVNPELNLEIQSITRNSITFDISNQTPDIIKHIALWVNYYMNDSLIHKQKAHISLQETLPSGKRCKSTIYRDKSAREKKMSVKVSIIGYE